MTLWTAHRPWKGKLCTITLHPGGYIADLCREGMSEWTVYDSSQAMLSPVEGIGVHTDSRYSVGIERRLMGEGVATGLEERRDHLPGRFIICKAIGLAVHFGASRIRLDGTKHVTPRARRNLETMVRPLKSRRVDVWDPLGLTPFATEPRA